MSLKIRGKPTLLADWQKLRFEKPAPEWKASAFRLEVRTPAGTRGPGEGLGGGWEREGQVQRSSEGAGLGDHAQPKGRLETKNPDGLCTVPKSTDLPQTI